MNLPEFLRARLDEDEAAAREADATVLPGDLPRETHLVYGLKDAGFGNAYQGFALVHDPARVLREVEAKRAIVARCEAVLRSFDDREHGPWPDVTRRERSHARADLADLAAVYSDRPDYDPEWNTASCEVRPAGRE